MGGAGEVYRTNSPGKVASLNQCKKSCEDEADCKSITYFNSGWCSHFSSSCSNSKRKGKAVSMKKDSGSIGSVPEVAVGVGTWTSVGSFIECDTGAGEVYQEKSPGKVATLEECKRSCENEATCQSITFFKSGFCSLFSTPCSKFKPRSKAIVS